MITTLDKLVYLIISRFIKSQDALSMEDMHMLFEENPQLKRYLCEQYIEMPVIENGHNPKEGVLLIPAINVLMKVISNKEVIDNLFIELKEYLEPFKEVYYIQDKEKNLVHDFDLFKITQKSVDDIRNRQSLNIVNMNQFFICGYKSQESNYFILQPFHFDNHVKFNIDYEMLFLSAHNNNRINTKTLNFNSVANLHITLNGEIKVELRNMHEVGSWMMERYIELIKYKIMNNQRNFVWDENKLTTFLAANNNMFDSDFLLGKNIEYTKNCLEPSNSYSGDLWQFKKELEKKEFLQDSNQFDLKKNVIVKILTDSVADGVPMTRTLLSLLFVKNKTLCSEFINYLNTNAIHIYDGVENMPTAPKDELTINIEKIEDIVQQYTLTDSEVVEICKSIIDSAQFFISEKALTYFSSEIETKHNIDSIFNKFIPNILETYFNLPEKVRNDSRRQFKSMTVEQLQKLSEQLQNTEYDILEQEMRKMKSFGLFLDSKFS